MSDALRGLDPRVQAPRLPTLPEARKTVPAGSTGFGDILRETLEKGRSEDVRFSAHALERLSSRNVHLTQSDLEQIRNAVDKAAEKGSKEALLLKPDLALVVNVPNRTVITAVPGSQMKEHVFTKIDSAILLR